jgi:dihydroneopterin aldolase
LELFVKHLEFEGRHGVYEEERKNGRQFRASLFVELPDVEGTESDNIEHTIDYRVLAEIIYNTSEAKRCNLIEHLGQRMLQKVFDRVPEATHARLVLEKHATDVAGEPEWVGIELERSEP